MRRALALVPCLLLLATAPAQAVQVPGKTVARAIDKQLSAATGVEVTKATCPKRVTVRRGGRTTCRVRFASGDRGPAKVRFRNAMGDFKVRLVDLLLRHIEDQIAAAEAARGVVADVTCPKGPRRIEKGDTFACDAMDDQGAHGIFDVTQTGNGLARYQLRQ